MNGFFNKLILITIILSIPYILVAQSYNNVKWIELGAGAVAGANEFAAINIVLSGGLQITSIYYVSVRGTFGSGCFSEGCTTTNSGMAEIGGLFGVMSKMKKGLFRAGAGISYSQVEANGAEPETGIGLPIEGQASFLMGSIGLGAYFIGNINAINSYFGGGLNMSVVF